MPILTGKDRPDFLHRQVLTSRNVRGGWFTEVALGGLNHRIEHRLFPSVPSPNLRRNLRRTSPPGGNRVAPSLLGAGTPGTRSTPRTGDRGAGRAASIESGPGSGFIRASG
ncbi:hypothetical protein ACZ91_55825 [Streptomyces regensis]|nr:hypothetical protein ACZ91_55825 [Streptomyces regensis]